jgi:GNAT superfamily N-acetyltransferase
MKADPQPATLSPLDSARWNVVTAKATDITAEDLPHALGFCREQNVAFLIARCATTELAAVQAMEREGFQLMDTLVYFSCDITSGVPDDQGQAPVRQLRSGESRAVRQVASRSFAGYLGHYHADPRLDRRQCDELYTDWAERSCLSREVADEVLVATLDESIVAFATLRLNSDAEGEGVLFGVAPEAQGRGIYRSLMIGGMRWCKARGRSRMVVSTQVTNVAVQKVWTRLGFEASKSQYTFHKWF